MVENYVAHVALPGGIGTVVDVYLFTASDTDKAYDIVGLWADGVIAQGDTWVGSRLSKDGGVLSYLQL